MDILHYFEKVNTEKFNPSGVYSEDQIGNQVHLEVISLDKIDIVIFDVAEERGNSNNEGCSLGGNKVRKHFYNLYKGNYSLNIADLGTIKAGSSITDTYFAVKECLDFLMKQNVIPLFLGGSQDLVYANYLAYTMQEQTVNLVSIDARFGMGNADDPVHSGNYLSKVILHQPNVLFNYSNLAYQTYLVSQAELKLMDELFFDGHRLGELKDDIRIAEPIIRNADFINFNLSAIAQPYALANKNASPNGLNGEQACQLTRYAGMSDKLSSFGIFEFNPTIKDHGQSAQLIAQMMWYFIDGFYNRKGDFPACNKKEYTKYTVPVEEGNQEIVFYKSPKSDRWWMNVPYHSNFHKKYERHLMLPCSYEDYLTATQNEIPNRWFKIFQKLK